MRVVNLSSGSDGNLTYIESEGAKVLVDAGLSCKEIEKRLALLGLNGNDINAILITHEHSDHVKGVDVFASKFKTKIYAHLDGWSALDKKLFRICQEQKCSITSAPFQINDLTICAFKVPHDAQCCVGYTITDGKGKISICTDLGEINEKILSKLFGSRLVYLEANHDPTLLKSNINYCASLKKRILSLVPFFGPM